MELSHFLSPAQENARLCELAELARREREGEVEEAAPASGRLRLVVGNNVNEFPNF